MLKSVSKLRLLVDETRDAYLRGDVNYTIELDGIAERIEQEVSERFMELPLDADGVPIRVGDVVEAGFDGTQEIAGVSGENSDFPYVFFFPDDGTEAQWCEAQDCHHHAPTVEDVLREFAEKITDSQIPDVHPTYEEAVAEYAQRLQLREVDE